MADTPYRQAPPIEPAPPPAPAPHLPPLAQAYVDALTNALPLKPEERAGWAFVGAAIAGVELVRLVFPAKPRPRARRRRA